MKRQETEEEKFERAVDIFCLIMVAGALTLVCLGELAIDRIATAIDKKKEEKAKQNTPVYRQQDIEDLKKKEALEESIKENYTYQR